jgi:murein DD-endopeptidase MepM/ murein hydrolase activator NlpD
MGTPYGRRGPWWSCRRINGMGIHTGVDYPAPVGTLVVAARGGKVVYANHGWPFGFHQLEILHGDGTRDFYAHMSTRLVANGARIRAGHVIGRVGAEGNVTGPHLHFERHSVATGGWSCAIVRNPQPSIDFVPKRLRRKKKK